MGTRIKDIAEKLGVSTTAVSLALSGKGNISTELREKVLKLAKKLNYQRNEVAARLASKKGNTIGVFILESYNDAGVEFHAGFQSIQMYLRYIQEYGYDLLLFSINRDTMNDDMLALCMQRMVDGVIVLFSRYDMQTLSMLNGLIKSPIPTVLIEMNVKGKCTSNICFNNHRGISLGITHLMEIGHKDIGFVKWGKAGKDVAEERLIAFKKIMQDKKIYNKDLLFTSEFSLESAYKTADDVAKIYKGIGKPTAIIASGDIMAIGLIKGLEEVHKIKVPQDISVMGYDGFSFGQFMSKKLTTIKQDLEEISYQAVEQMFEMIKKKKAVQARTVDVQLLKGDTTSPPMSKKLRFKD